MESWPLNLIKNSKMTLILSLSFSIMGTEVFTAPVKIALSQNPLQERATGACCKSIIIMRDNKNKMFLSQA